MANEVNLKVRISDDGTLDIIAKKSKAAAKATDDLGTSTEKTEKKRNRYHKGEKGVAGATANSTKAFSKMNQSMTGSSGLVGAYATLAANVFAATAAFGALQRAAEFRQLEQSVDFFGDSAGRNLDIVIAKLKDVTDGALSTEQALRSAALATASGFSTAQLEDLAQVAAGASKALGRDLTDSFDRLVRGAAKLEPEILDELGIMVRLDDAVEKYAVSIGKSAESLSQFERRQAFLNATIEAGTKQFGELNNSVDVNPYNQLAAAFNNLVKDGIGLLNDFLIPVVNVLSNNQAALTGSLILFGSTISRTMLPALAEQTQAMADMAGQTAENSKQQLKGLDVVGKSTSKYNQFLTGLKEGKKGIGDYKEGLTSLNRTISMHKSGLDKMGTGHDVESAKLREKRAALAAAQTERTRLITAVRLHQTASAKLTATLGLENLAQGNLVMGFKTLIASIGQFSAAQTVAGVKNNIFATTLGVIRTAGFAAMLSIRALGQAFFALLGPLGLLLSFGPLLYDFFKNRFFPEDESKKKFDEIREGTNRAIEVEKKFIESSLQGTAKQMDGQKKALGLQLEVSNQILKTIQLEEEAANDRIKLNKEEIASIKDKLTEDQARLAHLEGLDKLSRHQLRQERSLKSAIESNIRLLETLEATNKATFESLGEIGPEAIQSIKKSVEDLKNSPKVAEFMSPQVAQLEEFLKLGNNLTKNELLELLESIEKDSKKGTAFLNGLTGSVQKLIDEQTKLGTKAATPYDKILESAQAVQAEFGNLTELTPELKKKLEDMGFEDAGEALDRAFGGRSKKLIDDYVKGLDDAIETLQKFPNQLAENKQAQKDIAVVANQSTAALKESFRLREEGFKLRQKEINAQRTAIRAAHTQNGVLSEQGQILLENQRIREAQLNGERKYSTALINNVRIRQQEISRAMKLAQEQGRLLDAQKKSLDLRMKAARVQAEINNLMDPSRGYKAELSAADELALFQKMRAQREEMIGKELSQQMKIIELEAMGRRSDIELSLFQLHAAGVLDQAALDHAGKMLALIDSIETAAVDNSVLQANLSLDLIDKEGKLRKRALIDAATAGMSTTKSLYDKMTDVRNTLHTAQKDENYTGPTNIQELLAQMDPRERLNFYKGSVQEFMDTMAKLGPDGEFVASVAQGAFAISDIFVGLGQNLEKTTDKMEKASIVAGAVGQAIGQVNNILQAGYQRNIAKIDEQIAAEKKRDGKSKASLQKIAQMEKKKEAQERKAFEMNKKMLIAQTIMNTAAGVMATMKTGGFFASPLAMIVAAMGAAQIALIASQSYQGGGSASTDTSTPSSISLGKRASTVDLAKSRSASGEIAYMRGESGVGGPENFRPSFEGRYRAEGGSAGLVVGEQGPELFVPEVPGRVIPNDDMEMGGTSNITFNINTVDATGVEELLVSQRGNIIGMLRESANSYGQTFLEDVDTTVYTPQAGGVGRY